MKEQQTININPNIPKALIIGLFLGLLTVFIVNHFGEFISKSSYNTQWGKVPAIYYYDTPFKKDVFLSWSVEKFLSVKNSNYYGKINLYIESTFSNYRYILLFSLGYSILSFILFNYKIRFSKGTKGISLK